MKMINKYGNVVDVYPTYADMESKKFENYLQEKRDADKEKPVFDDRLKQLDVDMEEPFQPQAPTMEKIEKELSDLEKLTRGLQEKQKQDEQKQLDERLERAIFLLKKQRFYNKLNDSEPDVPDMAKLFDIIEPGEYTDDPREKPVYSNKLDKFKHVANDSAKDLSNAAKQGLKLAAVSKANEAAYDFLITNLVSKLGVDKEALESPGTKKIIMALLPMVIHPLASMLEDTVPYAKHAKDYANITMTEEVRKNSAELLDLAFGLFSTMAIAGSEAASSKLRIESVYESKKDKDLRKLARARGLRIKTDYKKEDVIRILQEQDAEIEEIHMAMEL